MSHRRYAVLDLLLFLQAWINSPELWLQVDLLAQHPVGHDAHTAVLAEQPLVKYLAPPSIEQRAAQARAAYAEGLRRALKKEQLAVAAAEAEDGGWIHSAWLIRQKLKLMEAR